MHADEHGTHALALEAEPSGRPAFAAQRLQARERGVEPFLPSRKKANDGLRARLRNTTGRQERLLLERLSRCSIGERGDHEGARNAEPHENHGQVEPEG